MEVTTIGLDLAKSIFRVHGVDTTGQVVVREKVLPSHFPNRFYCQSDEVPNLGEFDRGFIRLSEYECQTFSGR